ncbi:MAG: tetratricopeptide repeat protein [Gammaproteobacteria bacterium]|nr:tetratricopeptide repeat protein [Gammaproteobacteria bacterium]
MIAAHLLLAGGVLVTGFDAAAQEEQSQGEQETRKTPAMREKVYQPLAEAQECADMEDWACAQEQLERVRRMTDLNSYELAQMWNFYAFVRFSQDDFDGAIEAYENVIAQPELPLGLETSTVYALAQMYVQQERYQEGLDMLNRWFELSENPAPEPYVLKAQIHYQMQQYEEGIEPIQTAMEIAQRQNKEIEEGWYQLLNVFYFELENYPKVIETLTILVENWPKKDYLVQLAGMYGQEGQEMRQLALYEAAYEADWLTRGQEVVNLAQMLLQAEIPYKAAVLLERGLEDGSIESSEQNWRLLSQAWQLAQEDEKAIPALTRAAELAEDGELNVRLAQSHANLANWEDCIEASRTGLQRGGLSRPDQANLLLGNCLAELKRYEEARAAFQAAARDERSRSGAEQWLQYIQSEQEREEQIRQAMNRGA